MKTRITLFLILSMLIFIPDLSAGKIEINLLDTVTLKEKTITFSDVSTITGSEEELVNKIKNIEIGRTPWPDNIRRIDRDFLLLRLKSSNVNAADIVFNNAGSVKVSVESTKIAGHEIAQEAKKYLLDVLPVAERETTVELVRLPGDQIVARKRSEIDFHVSFVDTSKDRGNIDLIVSATSNGIPLFKVPVYFKVRVFEYVAIAKRKIDRHQYLNRKNLFLGRRETTKIRGLAFSDIDNLIGKITTMAIQPYNIITEEAVEIPPTVTQGSIVKLFIKSSGFRIVTKGLAQQTGYTGEVIKVKNLESKKMLYGKIIDTDKVQIAF